MGALLFVELPQQWEGGGEKGEQNSRTTRPSPTEVSVVRAEGALRE